VALLACLVPLIEARARLGPDPHSGAEELFRDIIDHAVMADAAVHGGDIDILIAAAEGHVADVADAVERCGGVVAFRDDVIDYLRVRVSSSCRAALTSQAAIRAARFDGPPVASERYGWTDLSGARSPREQHWRRWPRPTGHPARAVAEQRADLPGTPVFSAEWRARASALDGREALAIDRLRTAHPTFDGRGVTIAFIEPGASRVAIEHPALSTARALDGSPIDKIAGFFVPPTQPFRFVHSTEVLQSAETRVQEGGITYHLPHAGRFHLGRFEYGQEVFPVLWDPQARTAWVDTNHDLDFRNDRPLTDWRIRRQVERFGPDELPWASGRLFVAFNPSGERLVIHEGSAAHALAISTAAAGAERDDNLAVGVAPGARVFYVDVDHTPTWGHALLEGIIIAARERSVDIMSISAGVLQDAPIRSDGFAGLMLDRIVDKYDKLIVAAAGNAGTLQHAHAMGDLALSVGAWQDRRHAALIDGIDAPAPEFVTPYTSRGPLADGGLAPTVVAPTNLIGAAACEDAPTDAPAAFTLPACYDIAGGTSTAAPVLAAVAATLLSGARQEGIPVTARQLSWALRVSARFLPASTVREQGLGIPQADRAWEAVVGRLTPTAIRVEAPLDHVLTSYARPNGKATGRGLYEREGWTAGQRGTRVVRLTRTSGVPGAVRYRLSWKGNDGTFGSPTQVSLPLGRRVDLPVSIQPRSNGVHDALLVVGDDAGGFDVAFVPCTIIAAPRLDARVSPRLTVKIALPLTQAIEQPFLVPAEARSLQLSLALTGTTPENVWVNLLEPAGWNYHEVLTPAGNLGTKDSPTVKELVIPHPRSGTWVVTLARNQKESHPRAAEGTLEIALQQDDMTITSLRDREIDLTWHSTHAVAVAKDMRGELAVRELQSVALTAQDAAITALQVPNGATAWQVAIHAAHTPVSAYLYECSSGTCIKMSSSVPAATLHHIRFDQPTAGLWKIALVPAPGACGASSTCDRAEIDAAFVLPSLGTVQARGRVLADGRTVAAHLVLPPTESGDEEPRARALIVNSAPRPCRDTRVFTVDGPRTVSGNCLATAGALVPLNDERDTEASRELKHRN
jgi:hypothetical protein